MSESIRIKTTPNGTDQYLKLKVEQKFDFIEILSLKISQDKVYENFCSDYGAIVGRVTIGNGFGIPNAKVSVFIPIDDVDMENPVISSLYPYETVNDKNSEGVRYNLLPKEPDAGDDCYTPVGTFPVKREVLDNEEMSYVYCKYYKFTSVTNYAGDFMIFGVPLGQHVVHVDADLSNIGVASQRPYDFIDQGTSPKMFYSNTKFASSKNLNTLPQIKSINTGVNVQPFWGNLENCEIGINRLDIDLNFNIRPAAIFMGGIFGDSRKNSINKNCRPRKKLGRLCEQVTREGTIEMLRKTVDGEVERFDIEGGRVIDENGAWAYQIPMNLDYVVTNEVGNIVPSEDSNRGVPTRARVRFRVSMDEGGRISRLRTRGKYIIPNNPTSSTLDFSFDATTKDTPETFRDFYWNKIYSVKSFIPRFQRNSAGKKSRTYTGIKDVDACVGDKSPMPFSRAYTRTNVLFVIFCIIITIIASIVSFLNGFLCFLKNIKIPVIKYRPFKNISLIPLTCPLDDPKDYIVGGRKCGGVKVNVYTDCVAAALAEQLDMFQFDFYNEWINGVLWFYLLKYKKKKKGKEKFCETYCGPASNGGTGDNKCNSNVLVDTTFDLVGDQREVYINNGILVKKDNNLYYPPTTINGSRRLLFATDIINLGSVFECDWQGFPKIIGYLTNTSYKIPPLVQEDPEPNDVDPTYIAGMVALGSGSGLFFEIDCGGLFFSKSCPGCNRYTQNIRRQCELNVDIAEGNPVPDHIGINQIYDTSDQFDTQNSLNRYVRNSFCLLNVNGSGISTLPSIPNIDTPSQGTSFNISGWAPNANNNGALYMSFRNFLGNNPLAFYGANNSLYMYFGIIPGKTALDKAKTKYFLPCQRTATNEFIIDTTVTNTSLNGTSDGSIQFTFVGGSSPFTYTWVGTQSTSYNFGPATTTTGGVITGLPAGTYQINAVDSLGVVVIKEVTVGGPPALDCSFNVIKSPTTMTSANGEIEMVITGGVPPYNVTGTLANGQRVTFGPLSNSVTQTIYNIPFGTNTFRVTDSATPQGVCNNSVVVTAPPPVVVSINSVNNEECDSPCTGGFEFSISGGERPYTVAVTGPNGFNIPAGTSTQDATDLLRDLCKGPYTITATDSLGQTDTKTAIVYGLISPIISYDPSFNYRRQCESTYYTIRFLIAPCNPGPYDLCGPLPYTLTYKIDGTTQPALQQQFNGANFAVGQNTIRIYPLINAILTLQVNDNQCDSNEIFIPAIEIKRPTRNLAASYTNNYTALQTNFQIVGGQPPYTNSLNQGGDPTVYNWLSTPLPFSRVCVITDSVGCTVSFTVNV